jgi:energy-coupling factor transporter ATP-binding protein EcfA2
MTIQDSTTLITERTGWTGEHPVPQELALIVMWSRDEPERLGEALVAAPGAGDPLGFGRSRTPGVRPLEFARQRPGETRGTGATRATGISRTQWQVRRSPRRLEIDNVGRRALHLNGVPVATATVRCGDLIELEDELVLLAVLRPIRLAPFTWPGGASHVFGDADAFGIVGESVAAWELRRQLAFAAGREDHVLITGASGTGKELAAKALHGLSRRASERLVARNAATLPDGLVDAELFGNVRDYPNPGMAERPGLIGSADGSTLFLDEIGELPHGLQAHLLRVLDGGEYQRLGESRARRADLRVVAATNRATAELKHDLLARLRLRVALPGLDQRRDDIPLVARHLLRRMAAADALVASRCFIDGDPAGAPRWTARFVSALVQARYGTHVRELEAWLWQAILDSSDGELDAVPRGCADATAPGDDGGGADDSAPGIDPRGLSADHIRAALDQHSGNRERSWRALGLRSRHQLLRLMRRHGM